MTFSERGATPIHTSGPEALGMTMCTALPTSEDLTTTSEGMNAGWVCASRVGVTSAETCRLRVSLVTFLTPPAEYSSDRKDR